jgi:hypothetical protein
VKVDATLELVEVILFGLTHVPVKAPPVVFMPVPTDVGPVIVAPTASGEGQSTVIRLVSSVQYPTLPTSKYTRPGVMQRTFSARGCFIPLNR